jgi:hypothetical protein
VGSNNVQEVLGIITCWYDWYYSPVLSERIRGATQLTLVPLRRVDQDSEDVLIKGWMCDVENPVMGFHCQILENRVFSFFGHSEKMVQTYWVEDRNRERLPVTLDLLTKYDLNLGDE